MTLDHRHCRVPQPQFRKGIFKPGDGGLPSPDRAVPFILTAGPHPRSYRAMSIDAHNLESPPRKSRVAVTTPDNVLVVSKTAAGPKPIRYL